MTAGVYSVAIAGATGVVGGTVRSILEERGFPVGELRLLASERSRGKQLAFRGEPVIVEPLTADSFAGVDLVFFAAGGAVSTQFAPAAVRAGATVIDKSSVFRQDPQVPLVVPEVNADALDAHKSLIATPNCSTIQMVVALKPIHDAAGIERVVVSTYQATSCGGRRRRSSAVIPPAPISIRTRSPSTCCRTSTASSRVATRKRSRRWSTRR